MWDKTGPERIRIIGIGVAVLWLVLCGMGLMLGAFGNGWLGPAVAILLPLLMIVFATQAASAAARLRDEAGDLRRELATLRAISGDGPRDGRDPGGISEAAARPQQVEEAEGNARPSAPAPDRLLAIPRNAPQFQQAQGAPASAPSPQFTSRRDRGPETARAEPQGELALEPAAAVAPPLPVEDLIRALHFPESPEDTEGFRALRRALRDHQTALLIQAAQDVLTLLSQDGIYMEDLTPDRARPELWRRFAQGERGGQVGTVGGIRDRSSLALTATRMREDSVFRDAAHHFLRRFDRLLSGIEPEIDDETMIYLTDTRTARAFMLVGRVSGIFD